MSKKSHHHRCQKNIFKEILSSKCHRNNFIQKISSEQSCPNNPVQITLLSKTFCSNIYRPNIVQYTLSKKSQLESKDGQLGQLFPVGYYKLSLPGKAQTSTAPLRQWGFRQCLLFSWTTPRGKHCRHPIAIMGVVDTFGQGSSRMCNKIICRFIIFF